LQFLRHIIENRGLETLSGLWDDLDFDAEEDADVSYAVADADLER